MLTRRIIPCLDVDGGRVVKGLNFESIRDAGDPVELATRYGRQGADELIFLDITASQEKRATIRDLVSGVARVLDIPFTVGGGVSSMEDARNILLAGADKVGVNTGAVGNPALLTELMSVFGRQCVVLAIDAKRRYLDGEGDGAGRGGDSNDSPPPPPEGTVLFEDGRGKRFWFEVFVYGGKKGTGIDAVLWAKRGAELGAGEILLTSIDRDGTGDGYDLALTGAVVDAVRIPVIASGGCGRPEDMLEVFAKTGVDAALAASIFHYESGSVDRVKGLLQDHGVPVRL